MSAARAIATEVPRFAAPADGMPTPTMLVAWSRDGLLILEDFLSAAACHALIARANEIVKVFDPSDAVAFSTRSHAHERSGYFLESGDKVRCFLEEEALDAEGTLLVPKTRAVNKIGHALHDLDPVFSRVSRDPRLACLAQALGVAQPLLLQSMYIFKQPKIGGEVVCHQDATFLRTEPQSVIGLWFALEDATPENGCLEALAGRHRAGPKQLYRRHGKRLDMDVLDSEPWPESERTVLPARRGTLIAFHGSLPHLSGANRSPRSRQAYTLHVIDGACRYLDDNWLQRGSDIPLRGFA
ncbi:MAG: phytanoyl-CoA dioxygenase family protein [Kiloniellales bacterium]